MGSNPSRGPLPTKPITGAGWARAQMGQAAAAAPSAAMNSRRLIRSPRLRCVAGKRKPRSAVWRGQAADGREEGLTWMRLSLDHLIRSREQCRRHGDAERLGGFEIDD